MSTFRKQGSGLDFAGQNKIKGLQPGTQNGEGVEYGQLNAGLDLKQDILQGGSGIDVDGIVVKVDLATAGSDYSSLTLSSTGYASLDGEYQMLDYRAYLSYVGFELDLTFGGDYNVYYKDNGSGVWSVLMKREVDGDADTNEGGLWIAVLVTVDPTTITSDYNSFVPNHAAVDFIFVSNSNVQATNGFKSPFGPTYGVGSTPAGLKFDNDKLALDFAQTIGDAVSTKVFPSSVIKTYVDEKDTESKQSSNNVFSNTIAQLSNDPSNVQSALESVASEIDSNDSAISALQTQDIQHTEFISDNRLALGISIGDDDMGEYTTQFVDDDKSVKENIEQLGGSIHTVYQNLGAINGLNAFETDFGGGFIILPNNSDVKSLFQATESELQNLAQGLGQFWLPVYAYSNSNVSIISPASDEFGGAVVPQGERVLLVGQSDPRENGIYIFDEVGSIMSRVSDADSDEEFTINKTVQVLNSSEDGIAGATFAYTGGDDPQLSVDNLTFSLKSRGVVGDASITEIKLSSELAGKINAKADRYEEIGIDLVQDVPYVINHGLDLLVPIVKTFESNNSEIEFDIDIIDSMSITIKAGGNFTGVKVAII